MVDILMTGGIVLLILGSIVEVAMDIRDGDGPAFLPSPLAELPSSQPATALGVAGVALLVIGVLLRVISHPLPGGHLVIGLIAIVAFLLSGGYIFADG